LENDKEGNLGLVSSYYLAILFATLANLALAAVALVQRAKQIRGNKLRERQVQLAEARNELAEERLRSLQDQIVILSEIRDALCPRSRTEGRAREALRVSDHNGLRAFPNAEDSIASDSWADGDERREGAPRRRLAV